MLASPSPNKKLHNKARTSLGKEELQKKHTEMNDFNTLNEIVRSKLHFSQTANVNSGLVYIKKGQTS